MSNTRPTDFRIVPCEACQTEGRIYRMRSRHWGLDPEEIDCGECPACDGTGGELIVTEPLDELDVEFMSQRTDCNEF